MFALLKMLFVYVTLGGLAGVIGIPYSLIVGNVRLLYRVGMAIARLGVRAAGVRVEITGLENVPEGVSCLFLVNHVSNLDPPVLFPALPGQASVMLKKELMRIPLLGTAMRMAKFVPVERGRSREAAQRSVTTAAEALRAGLHFLIFPEGTRSRDGRLSAFKRGPFYLAMETGAPVVPVAISGTQKLMRKGSASIRPGVVRVQMLPAIWPKDFETRDELMQAVRTVIAETLPEEMKPVER
ncbi:MAG TPA: lysophospholipid acyltransferase family protein [Acidobacteriaceae bacterium]|jgi:1-acyl-sn-glycerol-3-phosphate acyltransferase|nr:lysophospholipid acyltransferase family protein [Acidobacteriaceae bacterium]